jgi:chromosome transmission fidelity protein 1
MSDYSKHLFSYLSPDRLHTFSFGHVIPAENLTAQVIGKGLHGSDFNFTFEARYSDQMVKISAGTQI